MPTPAAQEPPAQSASRPAQIALRQGYAPQVSYAGFWIRLVAYMVDAMILAVSITGVAVTIAIVVQAALYWGNR